MNKNPFLLSSSAPMAHGKDETTFSISDQSAPPAAKRWNSYAFVCSTMASMASVLLGYG